MDDSRKTRQELLLEVQALRRQLAESLTLQEVGDELSLVDQNKAHSEQSHLLASLESERNRLMTIIDCAPEGIIVADAQGRIILANRMSEAICGQPVPRGDFASLKYLRICQSDGSPCELRQSPLVRAALDGETSRNVEMGIYCPDGTLKTLRVDAAPIRNRDGQISGAVSVLQDISDLKRIEREQQRLLAEVQNYSEELRIANEDLKLHSERLQTQNETLKTQAEALENLAGELEASRNLLAAVLEQMPAGVIIADPAGQVILSNRRAGKIWEQSPDSLRDLKKFQQLPRLYLDGRPCPAEDFPLGRALNLGETVVNEEYLVAHNGDSRHYPVHLKVNATPVRDQHGAVIAAVATYEDITLFKQAQAALRQSEARYRSLVELSPEAIVVHVRGKIIFVNRAAVRLFGAQTRHDLLGQPIMDRMHPDYHDKVQERIWLVRSGQAVGLQEEQILRLDGEAVAVEAVGGPIIHQGRAGVQVIFRDITEKKRVRAALQAANAQLQALIESSPLAIVHLDPKGLVQTSNPAAQRIFGWTAAELAGRFLPISSEVKRKRAQDFIQGVMRGRPFTGKEVQARRKDRALIAVSISAAPLYDANGEVSGIVGLAEDITARKQAEAALNKSRAEFEAIFNSISDAIVFADPERRIILANAAVQTVFGYKPDELIGQSAEKLYVSRADFEDAGKTIYYVGGQEKPVLFEMTYRRKDGTQFSAESWANRVNDAQGNMVGFVGIHRDITARKVAEAALKESQRQTAMLADFLENSSQPFAVGYFDGRLGMCNAAYLNLVGYSQSQLSRLNWETTLTPPEWREPEAAKLEELRRTGQPVRYEKEYRRKDGTRVPVELFVHLRRDENGQTYYYAFVTDISARKRAEAALEMERQRLFDLLNGLPGFIFLHGEDFSVRFANSRCKEIFGDPKNELCYKVFHQRQTPCDGCPAGEVFATQKAVEWEQTLSDGRTFQIYKYPFRDIDGTPSALSMALDITARKRTEEALRESEGKFRQMAENIDDAILLASGDWQRVYYISPAYERIWGRTCASLYEDPRSWLESVVKDDLEEVKANLKKRMAGDFSEKELPPFRVQRPDGSIRWVAARFFPIRNEDGNAYRIAGVATDITVRKEIDALLQWRQEHLRQTAKMEAVGRLAGGVAHDFNNLLTVINGYGEMLLANLRHDGRSTNRVRSILKAADQASAVTRQLLAFSRKQVLQPETLDLNQVIANQVEIFSRLVDEDVRISVKLAPELGLVKADQSQMEQVFMNLAINALDAMPQGGDLMIQTARVTVDSDNARSHPEVAPGDYVVVTVADTGIGMTRDVISHIFEPFFTTKDQGKGTGLGLSMAYGIMRQSGGHIRVLSQPGKGSSFRLYLPCISRGGELKAVVAPILPEGRGTGTILLVEDEEGVRHVVERMLALKGYTVLTAKDGQEALQIGQGHADPINLLLTDVAMPVMGGRELAEGLLPAHPQMKVLFMSGHTEDGVVRRGVQESVINFIQKPFRTEQLLGKVAELLADAKP